MWLLKNNLNIEVLDLWEAIISLIATRNTPA